MTCDLDRSPSKNLRRFGQLQMGLQVFLAYVATAFCVLAGVMEGPVMNPDVYGPYVTSIKTEWWSYPILFSCMAYILGIKINGNWRWSSALRLYGALFHAVTLTLLATFGYKGGTFDPFIITSGGAAVINVWFIKLNVEDLYRAVTRGY